MSNFFRGMLVSFLYVAMIILALFSFQRLIDLALAERADTILTLKAVTIKLPSGTGFYFLSPHGARYLLTNQHVCEDGRSGEVLKSDVKVDLCALRAKQDGPAIELAPVFEKSFKVNSYGFANGTSHYSSGYEFDDVSWIGLHGYKYTSANSNLYSVPGMSGSPVVYEDRLVGVISSYDKEGEYGAGIVRYEDLVDFVGDL